jgi:hypothetical protein
MSDLRRVFSAAFDIGYLILLGAALVLIPAYVIDFVLPTNIAGYLTYSRTGNVVLFIAGCLVAGWAIMEGQLGKYERPPPPPREREGPT